MKHAALIYLAAGVLARAGSFLLVPIYTRRLTPEEYSSYATFTTLQPLLITVVSLGLGSSLSRAFFSPRPGVSPEQAVGDVARGMLGIGLGFGVLGSLLVALFLPGGAMLLDASQWHLLVWSSVGAGLGVIPETYLRVAQRAIAAAATQVATFFVTAGLGLGLVVGLGRAGRGAVEALAAASALQALFAVWFILRLGTHSPAATLAAELRLSLPFIPHTLALWAQQMGDRAVLSAHGSGDLLGVYYLAIQLTTPLGLVTSSWNSAQSPRMGEEYRRGGARAAAGMLGRELGRYGAVAAVVALLLVLASPLVPPLVGARFRGAVGLLPALAAASAIEALYFPSTNYLMFTGHTRAVPVASALSAAVSVGAVLTLLPRFGLPGLLAARVLGAAARSGAMGLAAFWYRRRDLAADPASPGAAAP